MTAAEHAPTTEGSEQPGTAAVAAPARASVAKVEEQPLSAVEGARLLLSLCARQCGLWGALPSMSSPPSPSAAAASKPPLAPHATPKVCEGALTLLHSAMALAEDRDDPGHGSADAKEDKNARLPSYWRQRHAEAEQRPNPFYRWG